MILKIVIILHQDARKYKDIIKKYNPQESGVRFCYQQNTIMKTAGSFNLYPPEITHIGGIGITDRHIEEIELSIPGTIKQLEEHNHDSYNSKGKIAFLGNGLSIAPLSIASAKKPPIIVDVFDYAQLQYDLEEITSGFKKHHMPNIFFEELSAIHAINTGISQNKIKSVRHIFGTTPVPRMLCDIALAINCHGPPATTLYEQLEILAPGGRLHYALQHYNREPFPIVQSPYQLIVNSTNLHTQSAIIMREQ